MRVRYRDQQHVNPAVQRVIEREGRKLDVRLAHVDDELRMLSVSIEQHLRDSSFTTSLRLSLPGHELAAGGDGQRADSALRDAFKDLGDQLDRHLAKLRGEPAKRREGKFHRDKAALVAELAGEAEGWPSDPPRTSEEAAAWAATEPGPRR